MILSATVRPKLVDTLGVLKLAAGATLLVALSWEILAGDHTLLSPTYLTIQLLVCAVFLCDFFVRLWLSERRGRFFVRHLFYLLISVPYLNLLAWSGVRMTHDWGILVGLVPMLRAFLAMFVIVQWMARGRRMRWLFTAYLFTVVVSRISVFGLVIPVVNVLLSAVLNGEPLFKWNYLAALALVCAGIVLVNRAPKRSE